MCLVCLSLNVCVFAVNETWITSAVLDSFVSIHGYQMVRSDTIRVVPKHGVCVYIQGNISFWLVRCDCYYYLVNLIFCTLSAVISFP